MTWKTQDLKSYDPETQALRVDIQWKPTTQKPKPIHLNLQ